MLLYLPVQRPQQYALQYCIVFPRAMIYAMIVYIVGIILRI